MPNWNENELTITGPDVNKVLEAIRSQSGDDQDVRLFDFNKIIPYPHVYRDMDKRAEEYREKLHAIANDDPERQQKLESLGAEYGWNPARRGSKTATTRAVTSGAAITGRRNGTQHKSISPPARTHPNLSAKLPNASTARRFIRLKR